MKYDPIKLSELVYNHPAFEENQVLTDDHLNALLRFLDQQDRQSRRLLHGYGTVCGLKLSFDDFTILLSKGCALTSDGDLIEIRENKSFTNFREFKDEQAKYGYFEGLNLTELVPDDIKKPKDAHALRQFNKMTGNQLADQVVVLYLESYLFDPDICTGGDCDNKGQEQINNIRFLLIPKEWISKKMKNYSPSKMFFNLDRVVVPRLRLAKGDIDNYSKLSGAYQTLISQIRKSFENQLSNSFDQLKPVLAPEFNGTDPTEKWLAHLREIIESSFKNSDRIQYAFSFLRDLAQAYNEFMDEAYELECACLPDIQICPKHVLLGDALAVIEDKKDLFRQAFVPSPILNKSGKKLQKLRFLFKRLGVLIESFKNDDLKEIKITPSRLNGFLSERAIPAYYIIRKERPLNSSWNFEMTGKDWDKAIYSYHAESYDAKPPASEPLAYDICSFDHFRIEGHLGLNVERASTELRKLILKNNVPIKVVPVLIENDAKDVVVRPGFKYYGMEIIHKLYRDELISNLNNVRRFNLDLNQKVQQASDDELPPVDLESNTISFKSFAQQQTENVNEKIGSAKNFLANSIEDFDVDGFEKSYKEVVDQTSILNRGVKNVTFASASTPLELAVNNSSFSKLKWIRDLVKLREDKSKEKLVFDKFMEDNPGLEHTGGCPRGGTFILLYSAEDKKVVADMSLPYWFTEAPVQEVPEKSDTSDDKLAFDWKKANDLKIYISPYYKLKTKMDLLDDKYSMVKNQIEAQVSSMKLYEGSIQTLVKNLPGNQAGGGLIPGRETFGEFENPLLDKNARILKEFAEYNKLVEDRKTAGTVTEAEIEIQKDMEKMMGAVIEDTIRKTSEIEGDIKPGSGSEKLLEMAAENTRLIKDEGLQLRLGNVVKEAETRTANKANYLNALNRFRK